MKYNPIKIYVDNIVNNQKCHLGRSDRPGPLPTFKGRILIWWLPPEITSGLCLPVVRVTLYCVMLRSGLTWGMPYVA